MSPIRRRVRISLFRLRLLSRGALAFALVFSVALLAGCGSAPKISFPSFERDYFIGTLEVERSFGHFTDANSLAIDGFGDVYVTDAGANGVFKFTRKGDSLHAVVAQGSAHGQFDRPVDVDASLTNSVAVADRNNHRIEIYSRDLIWQATVEGHTPGSAIFFGYPNAVRRGSTGYYYIIDGESHRLVVVNPATGVQNVVSTRGTALRYDLFPQSIALDGGEYIDVADVNLRSLVCFNNTYSPVKQGQYPMANEARITNDGETLVVFDHRANAIRLFDFRDLTYHGSYSLPHDVKNAVMVVMHGDLMYILTKEQVIVCSIHPADDLH